MEIVVAEDGTLVEKVLVINDEEIKLAECPEAVKKSLREHAGGGTIGDITRSTGISGHTFEAEVKIKESIYLIEVTESGHLISKSLEEPPKNEQQPAAAYRQGYAELVDRLHDVSPAFPGSAGGEAPLTLPSCMPTPCSVRSEWLILASDWPWVMRPAPARPPKPPPRPMPPRPPMPA